jgi:CelD/BcsL family acetyltransferase involved in cellulose biosynthesis
MADTAEQLGTLHLSWLSCDHAIIAVHLGFVHGNVLHYYMPSYDAGWSQFSPGSLLLAHLIGWCIENKVSSLDFMRGDDPYKCAYANTSMELTDFSFPGCLRGRLFELAVRKLYFRKAGNPARHLAEMAGLGTRRIAGAQAPERRPAGRGVTAPSKADEAEEDYAPC